ncbi:porin family protein [Roseivirga sp. BDSF3-8]|uniref:porin family protein n=1 Tax=Roseivirga sp. BDSF3-8 TaxID=3241598 RepID=UPI0035325E2D
MKKTVILLFFALLGFSAVQAQTKIGLKFSPTISSNRVDASGDEYSLSTNGVGLRFIFGPYVDVMLSENYYFHSGLLYVPKRVGVEGTAQSGGMFDEAYKTHYLQVPVGIKLFTNEVALDTRIFFQVGGALEILINEENISDDAVLIEDFRFFDANVSLGSGVEYRIGTTTILSGGITYNRGLVNVVSEHNLMAGDLSVKNDLLRFDIGVKF